jgi:hypothetical protein
MQTTTLDQISTLAKTALVQARQYGTFYEVLYDDVSSRFKKGEIGRLVEKFTDYKYDISICFGTGYTRDISGYKGILSFQRTFMFRMNEVKLVGEFIQHLTCCQCGEDLGPPRGGSGRQKELCRSCFKANRRRNDALWSVKRKEYRKKRKAEK